jgi:WASH complex subunit strumpellin
MNSALLADIESHYRDPSRPYPKEDNPLMSELTSYLESAGISSPLTKIYITTKKLQHVPLIVFLVVTANLPKLTYVKSVGELVCKKPAEPLDGAPFVAGAVTLLKQFHSENTDQFFALLGQYVRSMIASAQGSVQPEVTSDVINALVFLDNYVHYAGLSRKMAEAHIPTYILDQYRSQATTQ